VDAYRRVGSTNDLAKSLADDGAPAGSCVIAEEQIAGRGRERRSWASPPLLGVWISVVLRPPDPARSTFPVRIGLAVASALDPFCKPLSVMVKWPNDLLLADRKVGGILCETSWDGRRGSAVIAGIGVNVSHSMDDFPGELRGEATSIRIECGWGPPRVDVAGAIAQAVHTVSSTPELTPELLDRLAARDALRGRRIALTGPDRSSHRGLALGIDREGALRIRSDDGTVRRFLSGTVRLDRLNST
jgi:BirA family transcriptional regulator, biotin operon repressor / biotin---[acetyl-CoA-carboxylase] ligase